MENESLDLIVKEVENQQERELVRFESNLSEGINKYKEVLPADLITPQLQEKIDNEVKLQLVEFQKSIDLKPKALYHALKVETELNPDIEKDDLKQRAYDFLEKNNEKQISEKDYS